MDEEAKGGAIGEDPSSVSSEGKTYHGINAGRWTREEHAVFLKGLEIHGKEWKKIADMIKTRTVVQIRTHAQKYFQKVAKSTGGPVMSTSKKGDVVRPPSRKQRRTDGEELEDDEEEEEAGEMREMQQEEGAEPLHTSPHSNGGGKNAAAKSRSPPGKKPNSIRVPSFPKAASTKGLGKLHIDSKKNDEGGGVTPRTVAAATILLRPRIQHRLQTGSDTPKTREQASWLESHQERAAQVLGKRRRSTPANTSASSSSGGKAFAEPVPLSWEAASNR